MAIERMDHVGVIVDDLAAATEFFLALGLELQGEMSVGDADVDRIVGLRGARSDVAFLRTPDGHSRLEVIRFVAPPYEGAHDPAVPANAPGLRHLAFAVDAIEPVLARLRACGGELVGEVVEHGGSYALCYVRGPAGIIVELAERLGR
jgi:catechol 2,3-dioxygenase-like lactoylglutathione lyase family enzyme